MMQYSYSNVNLFNQCSLRWYLRYIAKVDEPDNLAPDDDLIIGTLLHDALEIGMDKAAEKYYNKYPIIDDRHVEEVIKVRHYYNEILDMLPKGINEYKLESDDFVGYIDLLEENQDGTFNIWDFKYSNSHKVHLETMQLHVYKYYMEKLTDKKIKNLKYLFVPKIRLKRDFDESTYDFRNKLKDKLASESPSVIQLEYDKSQVEKYFNIIDTIEDPDTKIQKNPGYLCRWCNHEKVCFQIKL